MIKSELIQRIAAQNPHLYQRDKKIVNNILDMIVDAMSRDESRAGTLRPVSLSAVSLVLLR
jgi:nucleoid DNA-binding protein